MLLNSYLEALKSNTTVKTEKGGKTFAGSGDPCVDLFYKIGGWRGGDKLAIFQQFLLAYNANPTIAIAIMLWSRDAIAGGGQRYSFQAILKGMSATNEPYMSKYLHKIVDLGIGYWKDLFNIDIDSHYKNIVLNLAAERLLNGQPGDLIYKWTPRKGYWFQTLRKKLDMSAKEFRKLLVKNTFAVEQQMCAKQWNEIDYSKVPSIASIRYKNAFRKHDEFRYNAWVGEVKEQLEKPAKERTAKVNVKTLYPHDIVHQYTDSNDLYGWSRKAYAIRINDDLENRWKSLPDYIPEGKSFIPVVDTSGSMILNIGNNSSLSVMDVALSLGLYCAERNKSAFKDMFITFSKTPRFQDMSGSTLAKKLSKLNTNDWAGTTNIEGVYNLLINTALANDVNPEDMPSTILILSDMQFDHCVNYPKEVGVNAIEIRYKNAGYKMPNIIFWNLRTGNGVPSPSDKPNVGLVSGFSPSLTTKIFSDDLSPYGLMMSTVNIDRYVYK